MQKISAIIISYNGMEFLPECITSLKRELRAYENEIIIVDNASSDGSVEYIERDYPEIVLIKNDSNLGFATAVNQGVRAARFEYLWILNQDLRFRENCLQRLLQCHGNLANPGIIGPRLAGFDGRLQKFCRRFPRYRHLFFEISGLAYLFKNSRLFNGWKMGEFDHRSSRTVDQPMGAAMLMHRSCIDEVGLMDESFGIFFNDVDWCYRLAAAGYENYYCYEAEVEHFLGGATSKHKSKMVWLAHAGMYRYFKKREKERRGNPLVDLLRLPLPHFAGLLLLLAAVPRSLYHWVRRII